MTIIVTISGGGGGFSFGTPTPELFDFESYNGYPATPGHIGRETLGGVEVEIRSPDWLR